MAKRKKKAAKKSVKKKDTRQSVRTNGATKPLTGMEDEFEAPSAVQEAADNYKRLSTLKARANTKFKGAKESLIEAMEKHDVSRVRIELDGIEKWLVWDKEDKIKQEAVKKDKEAAETPF